MVIAKKNFTPQVNFSPFPRQIGRTPNPSRSATDIYTLKTKYRSLSNTGDYHFANAQSEVGRER